MRLNLLVLAATALGICGGCEERHAGLANPVVGTWTLSSTEEIMRDGRQGPYPDIGPDAKGTLIYTPEGQMCVMLMRPGRKHWTHEEEEATEAEKIEASSGFSAYCGTYTIDPKTHTIVHSPNISFVPNLIGTMQPRPFRIDGDRLTFSGTEDAGPVARWAIVWRRLPQ